MDFIIRMVKDFLTGARDIVTGAAVAVTGAAKYTLGEVAAWVGAAGTCVAQGLMREVEAALPDFAAQLRKRITGALVALVVALLIPAF